MKRTILLTIIILKSLHFSYAQGSVDIDMAVQMGVANEEHVKITEDYFSVHPDVGQTPLIYGDFDTGNVGIGTIANANHKLEVNGVVKVTGKLIAEKMNSFSSEAWFTGWDPTHITHTLEDNEVGLVTVNEKTSDNSNFSRAAIVFKSHYGVYVNDLGGDGSGSSN